MPETPGSADKKKEPQIHPDAKPATLDQLKHEIRFANRDLPEEEVEKIAKERRDGKLGKAARFLSGDIVTGDLKKFKVTQNLKHNGRDYPIGSEILINPKEAASIGKHLFAAVSDKDGEAEE